MMGFPYIPLFGWDREASSDSSVLTHSLLVICRNENQRAHMFVPVHRGFIVTGHR